MILIKGGHIVDPYTNTDKTADILISDGKIQSVNDSISPEEINDNDLQVIDASGLTITPGLVDAHVHFRDPGFTYKEDIITGSAAAARGGVTTVILMANTKPAVDNLETLHYILEKGKTTGINVLQTATVTKGMKGEELVDMDLLASEGAAGFTDDGLPIMDESVLYAALKKAAELNLPVALHEEDPKFVYQAGVNKGAVSEKLGYGGADRIAEEIMTARDAVLALNTDASLCIQHISSKNSVDIVRSFQKMGADIHAEATPHHFTLTEEAVLKYGTNARMNPPVRTEEDRLSIIEGLKDGTIDMIVTDHAPHSAEEKSRPLDKAPSGITGIETSLALGIKSLVQPGHISLMKLISLMSENPAKFYHLDYKGISAGAAADLIIFGENENWIVREEEFASKASNSPFIGWELPGKIHYTICNGNIVYSA
ncbi:dihydroorotase [Eubacterium ruminantium]|uniref:dihydroorotase n=1 Tax=Eubacterium ruminantium TaxID=42322 RepID=UPI00156A33D6|nr:dihydroorotase [Eubacterium ruminantium]